MINIAMLGCDSSHTDAYAELINLPGSPFYGQAKLQWLWGDDFTQAQEKAKACQIPHAVQDQADAIKHADLVMISGRFGDSHLAPAIAALNAKKPTYIDKPFANDYESAREILNVAKASNTPLLSCSPLRFSEEAQAIRDQLQNLRPLSGGVFTGPAYTTAIPDPRAQKLHFYAVHMADVMTSFFGPTLKIRDISQKKGGIWVTLETETQHVTLNLLNDVGEIYHLSVISEETILSSKIDAWGDFFARTLNLLFTQFIQGKLSYQPTENALAAIGLLDKIESKILSKQKVIHG